MTSKDTAVPLWIEGEAQSAGSKGESSSSSNKPRFVPKIPVKKEKTAAVVVENGTAKLEKAAPEKTTENKFRNKPRESEGGRGGGAGRNPNFKPNQGRGGGRGQWVMPTGTAFFSGNATAPLPPVPAAKPDNVFRISRPNEDLLQAPMRPQKAERKADAGKEEVFDSARIAAMYAAKARDEYDSDDVPDEVEAVEESAINADVTQNEGAGEAWPPAEYNPKAPLTLPLGPKTASLRMMLAAEPILANPNDTEGLMKEELSSLFLLQMPSDLQFGKILESWKHTTGSEAAPSGVQQKLVNGRLGKLQLLGSGRVRLVTESGLTYQVSSGLAASFSQTLAAIETRDIPVDTSSSTSAGGGSSSSSSGKSLGRLKRAGAGGGSVSGGGESTEPVLDPSKVGDIHFMGNITKKLVLTPEYEIGTKKSKIPTESYLKANQNNSSHQKYEDEMIEDVDMS